MQKLENTSAAQEKNIKGLSRRELLRLFGSTGGAALLAACGISKNSAPTATATPEPISNTPRPTPTVEETATAEPIATQTPSNEMIRVEGRNFYLRDKVWYAHGFNNYSMISPDGCGYTYNEKERDDVLDFYQSIGANCVRFWAFPTLTDDGNNLDIFNRVLESLDERGMKAIPTWLNHLNDCRDGGRRNPEWYGGGFEDDGSYEYIMRMTEAVKGDPRIAYVCLINEPEAPYEELSNFGLKMIGDARAIDLARPFSLGIIGSGQAGAESYDPDTNQNNYIKLLRDIPGLQVATYHAYPYWDQGANQVKGVFGDEWNGFIARANHIEEVGLNVALVLEEYGIRTHCTDPDCMTSEERAEELGSKIQEAYKEHNLAGDIAWHGSVSANPSEGAQPTYDFHPGDPYVQIFNSIGEKLGTN